MTFIRPALLIILASVPLPIPRLGMEPGRDGQMAATRAAQKAATLTAAESRSASEPKIVDYVDPTYGARIRHLRKDDGHEHNLYYYRNPWNADSSRMVGIQSDLQQQNWRVVLYDGDGRFLRELFPISQFDWRLVWDRHDPHLLYTWRGSRLYRFHVDTGQVLHTFDGIGGGGHYAFSPDGKLAYFRLPAAPRRGPEKPLEIHSVNLDGTADRVLVSMPWAKAAHVQNLHLAWPSKVKDWFIASFFPSAGNVPATSSAPLDEILLIRTDGTCKYLARTGTVYSRAGVRGATGDMFWAQPLGSPSSDGRRICFNSNRAGTIDQYILYTELGAPARE